MVTLSPARGSRSSRFRSVARLLMVAVVPAALSTPLFAASSFTWDPLKTTAGSDGAGSWDLDPANAVWASGGADNVWLNDATVTATFGSAGTADVVTINSSTINTAGIIFGTTGSGSNYTIAAASGDTLTAPTIVVAAGESPTISAPIAGTGGLSLNNSTANGTLILTGANTYTGTTAINSGTLTVGPGGTLGTVSNALVIGSGGLATSVLGNLVLNNDATVGSITTTTKTNAAAAVVVNTISIGTGFTLTDTGGFTQGIGAADSNVSNTSMTVSGGGTLNISPTNNANFQLGGINTNNTNGNSNATLTMTTLGNFIYNTGAAGTGNFNVGLGFKSLSRLLLAANSTITASTLNVGNSMVGTSGGNNGGTSNLTLGTGTNILNVANIIIGMGKESGTINFPTAAASTLLIDGQAGGSTTANITVGTASSGSGTGTSTLLLAGHTATIQANTVIVGNLAGATNGVGAGNVTFDNGTFTASSVQLGVASSGGSSSAAGPSGTLTIGGTAPNTTATGVFNVTGSFFLANNTLGTSTSTTSTITSKGTFTINADTVNIGANIQVAGQAATILTLAGGTLNMEGFQINGLAAAGQSNTVNLPTGTQTATLENLGGTGINGQGLTTGSGNLILEGTNTYTGTTNISGNVTVGTGGTTGTLGFGGIILNGTLTFNRSAAYTTSDSINGTGAINQIGAGTIVLAGANAGGGPLNISNGTLVATGAFSDVTMASGALHPGTKAGDGSVGSLTLSSLTTTGGDLRFDIGAASDLITVHGPASFSGTTLSVVSDGALTPGTQTLLTASGGIAGLPTLTTTAIGRTTFSLATSGNNLDLTISGSAAALLWNGINGSTWNANDLGGGIANFKNGALQDVFFSGDGVTFNDSNTGTDAVAISGTVSPSSLAFTANSQDYTLTGGAIAGATGLTKSGNANLTLANANSFTGDTTITGGKLTIASGGSIASTNISVGSGASLTVAAGGDITTLPNLTDNGTVTLNNPARTMASLSGAGTVNLNGTALTLVGGGAFAGAIQGTGSLIVSGGTVILSGASGYTGGTSITGGTLQLGAGGATGSIAGAITVGAAGVLAIDLSAGNVTNAISGAGGVALIGGNTQIFTGTLNYSGLTTLTGALEVAGAAADSIGATAGTGSLIVGDGSTATSLTLTGAGNATGAVTVNAGSTLAVASTGSVQANSGVTLNGGTLSPGNASAVNNLGSGPLTITPSGGTLQFTATSVNNGFTNPIALNGNLTVNFNDSAAAGRNFTYAGNGTVSGGGITGSGNISIVNTGTLGLDTFILSNANPNLTGNILVGNATGAPVRLEVTDPLADSNILGTGNITVAGGSQIWFNQAAPATFTNTFNIAGTGAPQDTPALGAMRLQTGSLIAGKINLTGDATISIGTIASSTASLSGPISGAHALTLENGIFTLNNAGIPSSYGTGVAGSAATILGPSATAIVATPGSLSTGGLQLAGGGLSLNGVNVAVDNLSSTASGQTVSVTATTGQTNFVIASTLTNVNAGDNITGAGLPGNTVILNTATSEAPLFNGAVGSPTVTVTTVAGLTGLEIGDPITGLGIPAGTTITDIEGQTLTLSNNVTAILANNTASAANVTTGNVIVLSSNLSTTVTNAPLTILDGSVISNNGPAASATAATLTTGSDNSDQTFAGILVDGTSGGTLALVKNGSGMLALNGANTFTGGTTLNSGTLAGTGSLASVVTAGTAGHAINPGASGANSVGTLTLAGLTTNSHTTLAFDLASPTATNDLLAVTGSLTLAPGASLAITSQSVTDASSLGYYKVIQYGTLSGAASGILLPAVANHIAYTLDTLQDPGFIDIHRGFIGDANDDGKVDLTDLNAVLNNLGTATSSWSHGNFDGAATIDLTDLNDVLNNLGTSIAAGSAAPAIPTPEPASLALLGMGAAALIARRRKA